MIKNKKWRVVLYISIIVYVISMTAIFLVVLNIENYHNNQQREYEKEMKDNIAVILKGDNIKNGLKDLYDKERIELVVLDKNNKEIYRTIDYNSIESLKHEVNKNVIGNKVFYDIKTENNDYFVWLTVYFQDVQSLYDSLIFYLCTTIGILITLILFIILLLYQKMVSPLKLLSQNIKGLKNYAFGELTSQKEYSEYNALSKELIEFAHSIDKSISNVEKK